MKISARVIVLMITALCFALLQAEAKFNEWSNAEAAKFEKVRELIHRVERICESRERHVRLTDPF